jgi:hypothetical protein
MKKNKVSDVWVSISLVFFIISIIMLFLWVDYPRREDRLVVAAVALVISLVFLVIDRTLRLSKLQDTVNEIQKKLSNNY